LIALLPANFTGQILDQPREVRMRTDVVEAVRLEDSGHAPRSVSRDQFVQELLEFRRPFGSNPQVQISLMTLSTVTRYNMDGPWQGTAMLRMWGESQPGQPREVTLFLAFRVSKPERESLAAGGWLQSCALTQSLVSHSSRYLLRDVTRQRGIDTSWMYDNWKQQTSGIKPATGSVGLCDFNRDGILDLYVRDINGFRLYKGLADGKFEDVTEAVGLPQDLKGSVGTDSMAFFVDLDGDGWEDLILGGVFYKNEQGKRFSVVPTNIRMPDDVIGVAVADYDRDGLMDLYLVQGSTPDAGSWLSGRAGIPRNNQLWHNKGDWKFEEVSKKVGDVSGGGRSTFSAVWLDVNNDGWPDLYVINEFGDGVLYVNHEGKKFTAHEIVNHPSDFGSMGVLAGDIDNDNNIDIYTCNMYSKAGSRVISNLRPDAYPKEVVDKVRRFVVGSQLHRNLGNLRFEQLGAKYQIAAVGWSYGAAFVDLDNDGFLDIYAACGYVSRSRTEPDG